MLRKTTKPRNSHYSVPGLKFILCEKLHHSAFRHCRSSWSRFRDVYDTALGSQEHTCYRCSVLESHTAYLGRVDDTGLEHVHILTGTGIVTEIALALTNLLDNHATVNTCVSGNLTEWLLNSTGYDMDTCASISPWVSPT